MSDKPTLAEYLTARAYVERAIDAGAFMSDDVPHLRVLLAAHEHEPKVEAMRSAVLSLGDYGKRCSKCGHYLALDTRNADDLCWCTEQ